MVAPSRVKDWAFRWQKPLSSRAPSGTVAANKPPGPSGQIDPMLTSRVWGGRALAPAGSTLKDHPSIKASQTSCSICPILLPSLLGRTGWLHAYTLASCKPLSVLESLPQETQLATRFSFMHFHAYLCSYLCVSICMYVRIYLPRNAKFQSPKL